MAPPAGQANLSPYAGLQFFGEVNIDKQSKEMSVALKNIDGDVVFSKVLNPVQKSARVRNHKHD